MTRRVILATALVVALATSATAQYTVGAITPRPLFSGGRDLVTRLTLIARTQVELGSMGLQKATRPDVTAFARQMLTDYTRADSELAALADSMQVATNVVDARLRGIERRLDGLYGAEFERDYAQTMFDMNQEVVSMLRIWTIEASKRADDDPLTRWVNDMRPKAEQYLERARQLQQAVR
jgi:predicted outer membrane protein